MKLKLIQKIQETTDTISLIFQPEEPFGWRAGQFLRYDLPHPNPDGRGTIHYFTIASAPHESVIRLTYRIDKNRMSSFKNALNELSIDDEIDIDVPKGSFVIDDPALSYVFIAGGIGITPFRSILLDLEHRRFPLNIQLLYANRTSEIIFKDDLDQLARKHPNFKVNYVIEPERINEGIIGKYVTGVSAANFYVSGPEPMVMAMEEVLEKMGVGKEKIRHDYFPGYKSV